MEMRDRKGLNPLSGRNGLVTVETGCETQMVAASAHPTTRVRTLPTRSACTYWKVTSNTQQITADILIGPLVLVSSGENKRMLNKNMQGL